MPLPARILWYFDFISPYSYLAFEALPGALADVQPAPVVEYRPVLFAALLNHWGHKGPAEVAPKRQWTYEHVTWLAQHLGVPMRAPRHHPFNPLPLLRAAVAAGSTRGAIEALFRYVWRDGQLPDEPAFAPLLHALGLNADALQTAEVKATLRAYGEAALAAGVFGVPSAVATTAQGSRLFWGVDALPMLTDWLHAAPVFQSEEMRRAAHLPLGVTRPGAG